MDIEEAKKAAENMAAAVERGREVLRNMKGVEDVKKLVDKAANGVDVEKILNELKIKQNVKN